MTECKGFVSETTIGSETAEPEDSDEIGFGIAVEKLRRESGSISIRCSVLPWIWFFGLRIADGFRGFEALSVVFVLPISLACLSSLEYQLGPAKGLSAIQTKPTMLSKTMAS